MHNGSYEHHFAGGYNIRGNEMGHPHGYESSSLRRQQESQSSEALSHHGYDPASSVSFSAVTLSREQAPTRGSGRKERLRSDPNLLRGATILADGGSGSEQSDIFNHTSRSTSHTHSETPPPIPGEEEEEGAGSLNNLRLSDSEPSSFRRDDKGRISITKKSEPSS
jgi:hypothetical protein